MDASQLDEAGEPQAVFDCASDDRSFSVHLCHSRAREIEVLHDQLLDRFAADPTLRPRDILVMVPDVDAYAPYVEAVFGSAPDARFIPYSISDRGGRTESPLFESILALLSFQHSHWPASEIMALLETPAIRARFALSEDGLVQIEHWLLDNGVRWGRDAEGWQDALNLVDGQDAGGRAGHEEAGAGRFQNSWDAGLQRLLLGFAAGEEAQVFAGVAPAAGIDDQHRTELNALLAFVQRLDQLQSWSKLATPPVWSERLLGLIDDFFATPSDADSVDAVMLGRVRQCAVRLQTLTASADYNGLMSAAAVRTFVSDQFSLAQESPRFLTGQVSFCTLLPMRTIPFRSVFLVGMNDLDYPRRIPPSSFDLMRAAPRRGDRSRVMEDRQLFLEALLSARDELYISYVGRSDSDDSPRVPSVLVNDLLDYVIMRCVHCCPPPPGLAQAQPDGKQLQDYWRARFTQTHPLQPFSGVYFRDHALGAPEAAASPYPELQQLRTARVFTFDDRWYPDTAGPAEPTLSPEPMPEQIAFADLRSFMRNPARFLLEQCLGARIARSRDEVSDDEAFTLAGLQRWQLRSAALAEFADQGNADDVVSSADLDDWALYSKSSGVLPFGEYGTTVLAHQRSSLATFVGHVSDYLSTPRQAMELVLRLSDCTIEGTVSDIGSEGYLRIRPGAVNARDMVDLWLHHLVLSALGSAHCSRLIDEQNVYELAAVTEAEAKAYLGSLAQLMWQHRYTPVPLLVATAQAHARAMVVAQKSGKESDQKKVAAASRGAWSQSGGPGVGDFSESADAYVRRLWPGARPPEGFEVVAEAVYLPLFSRLEKKPHAA